MTKNIKYKIGQNQFRPRDIIIQIDKTIRNLEKMRYYFTNIDKERNSILPKCNKCGVRNVRVRMDKSYFCYSCGYDSKKEKQK